MSDEPEAGTERVETDYSHGDASGSKGSRDTTDPTVIWSIAVTVDDAVTALEANCRAGRGAVIRLTPPFAGRMRARLHVAGGEGTYDGPEPIHIDPESLFTALPAYPTADDTARLLPDETSPNSDSHRIKHAERLETWRETVRASQVATTTLQTPAGPVDVDVRWLGE